MRNMRRRLALVGRRARRDERGAVTIEFVLWLPILLVLVLTALDATLVFSRQTRFWNVSLETARLVSRHAMDAEAAEGFARSRVAFAGYTPEVDVRVTDQMVVVSIAGESSAMAPFGMLRYVLGDRIVTSVAQVVEPI